VLWLWPAHAFAWGPGAHLDFGMQVLEAIGFLAPVLRKLLLTHADDFLYGCIAGDIIVGKNLAPYRDHCHNWQVGLKLLEATSSEPQRALTYGFLTHLAADTIAHNYFIPYKMVETFHTRVARHAYWELRFDQVAHSSDTVWEMLRHIGRRRFVEHDAFLGEVLGDSSRLFSFRTSQRLFNSFMLLQRLKRWRQMNAAVARRSQLSLSAEEVAECNRLAQAAIFNFLMDGTLSRTLSVDPTGGRNLRIAKVIRRELRLLNRAGRIDAAHWPRAATLLRERFRAGIYGKLEIPDLSELALPVPSDRSHVRVQ
jgi:hypothetical protein